MARIKKITTDETKRYIDEFCLNCSIAKLTIPALGKFIRDKGIDVADYIIRRDKEARKYIDGIKENDTEKHHTKVVAYHCLDVDKFLNRHRSITELRKALTERETYYSSISYSAAFAFEENKKLSSQIKQLEEKNREIEKKMAEKIEKIERSYSKEKDAIITKLNRIINDYIYPEVANALLQKEGILEVVCEIIKDEALEVHSIKPYTDISKFRNKSVKNLLEKLDE
ncbi:MAG: hypothetical protein JJE17_00875 [Peptostreptococcaceae bacterium]|nr:hypothetical protein [Peptostreptococcaceae bacterium]